MDADYHFAAQFTADLIAMNHTDFIITSTFQEIAGTEVNPEDLFYLHIAHQHCASLVFVLFSLARWKTVSGCLGHVPALHSSFT